MTVSTGFKNASKSRDRVVKIKIVAGDMVYADSDIVDLSIDSTLTSNEVFTVGSVISTRLNFTLRTPLVNIPSNALIEPFVSFEGDNIEWLPLGKYYVDNRVMTDQKLWKFECYDCLMFLLVDYESSLIYPKTMREVLAEVVSYLDGVQIANIEEINPAYTIPLMPTDLTLHKVLGYIAGANGCSVTTDREGKIKFVKFSKTKQAIDTITMSDYFKAKKTNANKTFTRIKLYEDDAMSQGELIVGTGTDATTLTIINPFITEAMLNDLYTIFNGFTYIPYILDYKCFPYLELGDIVGLEQSEGKNWIETMDIWNEAEYPWNKDVVVFDILILSMKLTFKGGLRSQLKAETQSDQSSEFSFKGSVKKYIADIDKNSLKDGKVYNGVSTSRDYGLKIETNNKKAKILADATDGLSIWSDTGSGLQKKFYVDLNGKLQAKDLVIDNTGVFNGTIKANQILMGGSNGVISFNDLGDKPIIPDDTTITTITRNTISTEYIYASNLQVNSANIVGQIVARTIKTRDTGDKVAIGTDGIYNMVMFTDSSNVIFGSIQGSSGDVVIFANRDAELDANRNANLTAQGSINLLCNNTITINGTLTRFYGSVSFSGATVSGLVVPATFG